MAQLWMIERDISGWSDDELEATFTLEVNEWNGVSEPRLVLRHAQLREREQAKVPGEREQAEAPVEQEELVLF